jgi:hydroxymethylpyrimidine pyrophosphatase-like HAD family hydrolase
MFLRSRMLSSSASKNLLIAIDFDGTLCLRRHNPKTHQTVFQIDELDISALTTVKKHIPNCFVVLASGRNLLSLCRTLQVPSIHHPVTHQDPHFNSSTPLPLPVDYVVLGSGTVTMKWPSQEIVRTRVMTSDVAFRIAQRLILGDVDVIIVADQENSSSRPPRRPFSFFILFGPPHMERCVYYICEEDEKNNCEKLSPGFKERVKNYASDANPVFKNEFVGSPGEGANEENLEKKFTEKHGKYGFSQFLVIFESREDPEIHVAHELVSEAVHSDPKHGHTEDVSNKIRISHTTSPVNHIGVWLEVFPADISKSKALDDLEREFFFNNNEDTTNNTRLAIGNDHNDEDMLLWASEKGLGCLVQGGPVVLKERHGEKITMLNSPCGGGVREAIERIVEGRIVSKQ